MRNIRIIRITLTVLLGYIVFQALLYAFLHMKDSTNKNAFDGDEIQQVTTFRNIRDIVNSSHQNGIPLILVDPEVLNKVINITSPSSKRCYFFCDLHSSTVFGVLSKLWQHKDKFLRSLETKGFTVTSVVENDRDTLHYLSLPSTIRLQTHYLIQRSSYVVHIVILHERPGDYWWYGNLPNSSIPSGAKVVRDFTREGALDSVELIKVTMDGMKLRAPRYPLPFLHQLSQSTFIHCNYTRADRFFTQYGAPEADAQPFRDTAKHILSTSKHILDYLGIRFWLSSGTCLGWCRQCDIIPYSGDIDIGIWIRDYRSDMIPAMQNAGLHLKHVFGKETDSYELSFHDGDMKLDVFFFYEESDYMWNGGTQTRTGKKFKYIFPTFTLCWTEFLGLKLRVPCDTNSYLTANYGHNWFEPVRTWDWKSSPPNVRENGQWPQSEWKKVIVTYE